MSNTQFLQLVPSCGEGWNEAITFWENASPTERQELVAGLSGLGWVVTEAPDYESPFFPPLRAMPGNPCYGSLSSQGGGGANNPNGNQFFTTRTPSGLLDWLRALWARLSDALRRALAAFTGPWLAILAALLVAGGILLASRDRKATA
jgi:hypothetical protein